MLNYTWERKMNTSPFHFEHSKCFEPLSRHSVNAKRRSGFGNFIVALGWLQPVLLQFWPLRQTSNFTCQETLTQAYAWTTSILSSVSFTGLRLSSDSTYGPGLSDYIKGLLYPVSGKLAGDSPQWIHYSAVSKLHILRVWYIECGL